MLHVLNTVRRCEVILGTRTPGTLLRIGLFALIQSVPENEKRERREKTTTKKTCVNCEYLAFEGIAINGAS